jgi:serine/threonine protein kinase
VSWTEHVESTEAWQMDPKEITLGPRLAVGGFAEVFRAKWQGTDVAVKRLLETDRRTVQRLETEVRVLAKLRHPNVRPPPPTLPLTSPTLSVTLCSSHTEFCVS